MAAVKTPPRWWPRLGGGLHDERTASLLGVALAATFTICLLTGLVSHLHQHPASWLALPMRPVWGFRVTQGLHVVTGTASVPLLLAKLWTVFPRLFDWPPVRGALHSLERLSIFALVAAALFQLGTGLANIAHWYPWRFNFPAVHYLMSWVLIGALLLHIAVKLPVSARALRRRSATEGAVSRRAFLTSVGAASGVLVLLQAGQSVPLLRPLGLLAPRLPSPERGGLPVNRSATAAGVRESAGDPRWSLTLDGPRPTVLTRAELAAMPQVQAVLPIACVEGWSRSAMWRGVRLADLLTLTEAPRDADVVVRSLERNGAYRASAMRADQAWDPLALVALELDGEPLSLDHGFPARLITPNRPGVLQTKWIERIEVQA